MANSEAPKPTVVLITPPLSPPMLALSVSKENLRMQRSSACFLPTSTRCTSMRSNKGASRKASASLTIVAHRTSNTISKAKARGGLTKLGSYCCENSACKVWLKKLRCVGFIYSRIEVSEGSDIHVVSDENDSAWETLFVPSTSSHRDPNRAPTEVAPSTPVLKEGETPSIFETLRFDPDQGDPSPDDRAIGVATKIESKERMAQTPPLVSRPIQGYLEHTGIEACPLHQMDHGVRDPDCHHCKRALGPLYHHKIKQ